MDRQKELFDRGLKNAIDSFERAKEWADLSNCLQKAKQQIEKNKGLPIPRQRDLAKRLAQCLNPEINVIHQLTLEVYKEVFEREIMLMEKEKQEGTTDQFSRKSSVALFFSGLFNFYQFAAFEVKQTFLDIISSYLLKMKKELILSLPGFMLCMLPALEEQNGDILKKVERILADTEKMVGTSEFYGEIWKAMLRTPRARLPAIKYLDKKIPKTLKQAVEYAQKNKISLADYTIRIMNHEVVLQHDKIKIDQNKERIERMDITDYMYFYYPNKNELVINALVSGLQLTEINYVNRATLDFLISHMPLNDEQINTQAEKIKLVESASLTYTNRDFATLNKLQHWLFEQFDEEEEIDHNDPTVIAIVESQKNLFNLSMDPQIKEKQSSSVSGGNARNRNVNPFKMRQNNPILILLRIMSDENGITVPILKNISIDLIKFIKYHLPSGTDLLSLDKDDKRFTENLRNFLEQISSQYQAVLDSLAKRLNHVIENPDASDQSQYQNTIDVISYAIFDMKNLWKHILDTHQSRIKLTEILSTILTGLASISGNNTNLELIQPTLLVIERILGTFEPDRDNNTDQDVYITLINQKEKETFQKAIQSFNDLYIQMCRNLIEKDHQNNEYYKLQLTTYRKYSNILYKILPLQNVDSNATEFPEWLRMLIKCSKFESTQICLVAVENFIQILQDERGANQISDIKSRLNDKYQAILNIQRLIAVQSAGGKVKKIKQGQDFRKNFVNHLQEGKDPETKHIILNLWSQLDKEIDIQKIVSQLKELDLLVPKIFSDVVIQDLSQEQHGEENQGIKNKRQEQDKAIKKFSIFWKNTQAFYPNYKPFEFGVDGKRKKYCALHNMINFLEDTDPTLRLSCRSWLSQNHKQFMRILDPIIEEFILNSKFIQKPNSDNVYIESKFNTQYVIENFGKLRNIILNTQDEIIEYMITRNTQLHIKHLFDENKAKMCQIHDNLGGFGSSNQIDSAPNRREDFTYLDMLVEITLRFIQAEYHNDFKNPGLQINNIDNQVEAETLTVNASACEFMELILKQVHYNPQVSFKIAHMIIKPLINTFSTVIENENYAMMVNLINLLDLILNECNFQGKNQKKGNQKDFNEQEHKQKTKLLCSEIFTFKNRILLQSIKDGLTSNLSFVRQKFIKFVQMLIPYMRQFAKENESFKDCYKLYITDLIEIFCQLLKKVDVSFFSADQKNKVSKETQNSSKTNMQSTPLIQTANYSEKWQNALQNLVINQESDIINLIDGMVTIINTVLDIKKEIDGQGFNQENTMVEDELLIIKTNKNDQNKNTGFFGGIFGGGENPGYFTADIFAEVKGVIHERLRDVIVSCIYTWNQLPFLSMTDYHFTRYGMFAYSSEDTKKIMDEIKKNKPRPGEQVVFNFERILQMNLNSIQKRIIQLLRPVAKKIPDQFIDGCLYVWLHKTCLKGTNVDRSYQKIIQMLICIYQAQENPANNKIDYIMPVHRVIDAIIKYIQNNEAENIVLVHQKKWTKNNPPLAVKQSQSETLLCQFLFSYLVYNPTMYDPLFDRRSEDKNNEFRKIYKSTLNFFNIFKLTRNPFTICWLLEILNILCLKFKQEDAKLDNKLRKEFIEMFNSMLSNCAHILMETFGISFDVNQKYLLSLPPTVYELLFRYEYMQFKHQKASIQEKLWEEYKESPDTRKFSLVQQPKDFTNIPGDQMNVISSQGSPFFDDYELERLVAMKFEYVHSDHSQSIFKNMDILMKEREYLSDDFKNQSNFMEDIKFALRGYDEYTTPERFLMHTKFYIIITLKQILSHILPNLIGIHDLEKTNKSLQIIFAKIIELLHNDKEKNKNDKRRDKSNEVMIEFIIEFFASIVERTHGIDSELIKPYRKDIFELFNNDHFFKVSLLNLKQWQKIMKYFIDGKPEEILQEQMQLWNHQGGLFDSNNSVIVKKCYAMKRIAFLIFSSEDDDFQNQLDMLMKKMIEVFKQKQKNDIKQRLFLFFLTRVMLIRLNFQALTDALRKLWPHLLNELISVFEVQDKQLDKDNSLLTSEAFKLVELLSSLNIEDFQMNQWIFLIDGYGMKPESKKLGQNIKKTQTQIANQINSKVNIKDTKDNVEVFKTLTVKFIGDQEYSFYNVSDPQLSSQDKMPNNEELQIKPRQSISIKDQDSLVRNPQSMSISHHDQLSTLDSIQGGSELQVQAAKLQLSINESNVIGNEFNRQEAEAKIEIDFLYNDEMLQNKS